jgi:hypothetical protein
MPEHGKSLAQQLWTLTSRQCCSAVVVNSACRCFSGRESFHRCDLDNRSGVYKQLVEFGKVSEMDIRSAPSRLKQPIEFAIEPAAQIDAKITRITMRHPSASIDSSNTG